MMLDIKRPSSKSTAKLWDSKIYARSKSLASSDACGKEHHEPSSWKAVGDVATNLMDNFQRNGYLERIMTCKGYSSQSVAIE